ncbi:MAG: hypothetical protein R8K20_05095 [Gallionellaceae bacterium]
MSYLFQMLLLVSTFSCALLFDALWTKPNYNSEKGLSPIYYKSLGVIAIFMIYGGVDYFMLDYLMIIPGKIYLTA